MHLELRSAVIRSWSMEDAVALQQHANNRKIWLNLRDLFPHPYTSESAESFLKFVGQETPQMTFAIATTEEAIGCIGLRRGTDVQRKNAELGYWLGEKFWGRGIMTDAVAAFTRHAFETFDLERIYAEPFETNTASVRVLEKAGFVCEGRLSASILKDGKILNSFLYARTRAMMGG